MQLVVDEISVCPKSTLGDEERAFRFAAGTPTV